MNIILLGFSTTGKSSIIKEIKTRIDESKIKLCDSDKFISSRYSGHIYELYLDNFEENDPILRTKVTNLINQLENQFLDQLIGYAGTYICAFGPNIHIRNNFDKYFLSHKPLTIFFKADLDTVYKSLIRRESDHSEVVGNKKGFACWNQGVTRFFNFKTGLYESLSEHESKVKIKELIQINENQYSKYCDYEFDSTSIFDWHPNYDKNIKKELIDLIIKNVG
jgi:shikimate kinase